MANQIKRSEIAEEDLYKDIRTSAEKTIEYVEYLNETLKDTANVIQKELKKPLDNTIESIETLQKGSKLMNDTMEQSIALDKAKSDAIKAQLQAEAKLKAIEKEKLKLKEQLINATDEEVKAKIKYQKTSAEQKKILADEIIMNDKNAGTLEKVAAQSRILRREREKLNLETEEGKKRLKEINDQLDENNEIIRENSDALKKQTMNVGNYTDSIKEATGELGGLIGGIKDSIDNIKEQAKAFIQQAKAADTSAKKMKVLGAAMKATLIGLAVAGVGAITSALNETNAGLLAMQGTTQQALGVVKQGGNWLMDDFKILGLKIERATLQVQEFFNGFTDTPEIQKRLEEIKNEIANINKKDYDPGKTADSIKKAIRANMEYEWSLAKTNEEIERLMGIEEMLSEKAGDATISFDEQREAQRLYNETITKRIELEKDLAKQNIDVQAIKIQSQLLEAGEKYSLQQIKNLEFLEKESARMLINNQTLLELADAKRELVAKESELNNAQKKMAMERRNTEKDDFELQLDYAIDYFDTQKTVNERIINMERTTFEQRAILTERTRALAEKSWNNQIEIIEKYAGKKMNLNELLALDDEELVREQLKGQIKNETLGIRILQTLRDRKTALQDLADLESETATRRLEKDRAILDSIQSIEQENFDFKAETLDKELEKFKEIKDKEFLLNKKIDLEAIESFKNRINEIRDLKIKQLKDQAEFDVQIAEKEIIEQDEKAKKIEEINNKLVNDILRVQSEALDKRLEIDKDTLEKEKELMQRRAEMQVEALQNLTDLSNELTDRRISKIDEEIDASQRRFDSLQTLAESGNILAKESMAEEAKLMAEQNRKREQLERRKQRIQLASTVLETYLTNSANPDVKNPLQKTITDTVLLTEFIKSLPAFFEGTEDTGKNSKGVDNKGGFLSVLHPNERVITAKQNELIGGMSNEDLSKLAYNYQNGMIRNITDTQVGSGFVGVEILAKKLDSLERTIANKPEHTLQVEQIISGAMAITRTTKQGNTKIYNRYRV
jgi:hypothetical protein